MKKSQTFYSEWGVVFFFKEKKNSCFCLWNSLATNIHLLPSKLEKGKKERKTFASHQDWLQGLALGLAPRLLWGRLRAARWLTPNPPCYGLAWCNSVLMWDFPALLFSLPPWMGFLPVLHHASSCCELTSSRIACWFFKITFFLLLFYGPGCPEVVQ